MGVVVQLSDYRLDAEQPDSNCGADESFVPVEFAVGFTARSECLAKLAEYGLHSIETRQVNSEPDALLYLLRVSDAIWLNKRILERENLSDEAIAKRIDIVQMLENLDLTLMQSLWASFTEETNR